MKKWIMLLCAIVVLLAGCGKEPEIDQPEYTIPTLPSVDTELTPEEQINGAIQALYDADSFCLSFGNEDVNYTQTVVKTNGTLHSLMEGRVEHWLEDDTLWIRSDGEIIQAPAGDVFAKAKELVPNEDFVSAFCRRQLTLSPSNTGSFIFLLYGISAPEFTAITGMETDAENCGIKLVVSPEGYLSSLELTMGDERLTLGVTKFNEDITITAPDWVN